MTTIQGKKHIYTHIHTSHIHRYTELTSFAKILMSSFCCENSVFNVFKFINNCSLSSFLLFNLFINISRCCDTFCNKANLSSRNLAKLIIPLNCRLKRFDDGANKSLVPIV